MHKVSNNPNKLIRSFSLYFGIYIYNLRRFEIHEYSFKLPPRNLSVIILIHVAKRHRCRAARPISIIYIYIIRQRAPKTQIYIYRQVYIYKAALCVATPSTQRQQIKFHNVCIYRYIYMEYVSLWCDSCPLVRDTCTCGPSPRMCIGNILVWRCGFSE